MDTNLNELLENAKKDRIKYLDLARQHMVQAKQCGWPVSDKLMAMADKCAAKAEENRQAIEELEHALCAVRDNPKEVRRSLLRVIKGMSREWCLRELSDRLPQYEHRVIGQQLKWLSESGVLYWNGKRGLASKYKLAK